MDKGLGDNKLVRQVLLVQCNRVLGSVTVVHCFPGSAPKQIEEFCFPDSTAINPTKDVDYLFMLTGVTRSRVFGVCERFFLPSSSTIQYCLCILSDLPWNLVLKEIVHHLVEVIRHNPKDIPINIINQKVSLLQSCPLPSTPGANIDLPFERGPSLVTSNGKKNHATLHRPHFTSHEAPFGEVSLHTLVESLSAGNVIAVIGALLTESRLIFISSSLDRLSYSIQGALSLIYPFTWQHILVPVLPPSLVTYCSAPMPFVIGIHSSSVDSLRNLPMEQVIFIDLDDDSVTNSLPIHSNHTNNFPTTATDINLTDQNLDLLIHLHERLEDPTVRVLSHALNHARHTRPYSEQFNQSIRSALIQFYVSLVGAYPWYINPSTGEFDKAAFKQRNSVIGVLFPNTVSIIALEYEVYPTFYRDQTAAIFIDRFTESQLFEEFIQERKKDVNLRQPNIITVFSSTSKIPNGTPPITAFDRKLNSYLHHCNFKVPPSYWELTINKPLDTAALFKPFANAFSTFGERVKKGVDKLQQKVEQQTNQFLRASNNGTASSFESTNYFPPYPTPKPANNVPSAVPTTASNYIPPTYITPKPTNNVPVPANPSSVLKKENGTSLSQQKNNHLQQSQQKKNPFGSPALASASFDLFDNNNKQHPNSVLLENNNFPQPDFVPTIPWSPLPQQSQPLMVNNQELSSLFSYTPTLETQPQSTLLLSPLLLQQPVSSPFASTTLAPQQPQNHNNLFF